MAIVACTNVMPRYACGPFGHPEPVDANCLQNKAVERYLTALRDEVLAVYTEPDGVIDSEYVQFRYVLNLDGTVRDRCVMRSSNSAVAEQLISAFDRAAPFPPLPHHARCIAGAEVIRHVYTAPSGEPE